MRIERTKEWWLAQADSEGDGPVGAGRSSGGPGKLLPLRSLVAPSGDDETRIAFGKLVELLRRRDELTVEQLAERAQLDAGELLRIEEGVAQPPEPRTVYQLARTFKLPQKRLMQLAGLSAANDSALQREAVRFAARSESVDKLTREEKAALEEFIAVLSQQGTKTPG